MSTRRKQRSRYDLMAPSTVVDEASGEPYPDVMSLRYQEFEFTSVPRRIQAQPRHIDKPYLLAKDYYDTFFYDDILLDLNLVPHYDFMDNGMAMYVPSGADLKNFLRSRSTQSRRRV